MRVATDAAAFVRRALCFYQVRGARWLRVLFALAWAALIWWMSSRSAVDLPAVAVHSFVWNLGHVVVFGVLAALVLLSTERCTGARAAFAAILALCYGAMDELHQGRVDGRSMDLWDVCSDGLGGCIASATLLWILAEDRRAGLSLCIFVPLSLVSVYMASRG